MVVACAGCATPRQLWFGGDVHLGQGGAERLRAVSEALSPARGVVNLEGPIGREPESAGVDGGVRLSNGPQTGEVLAQLGIVAAGIANNHAGDLGEPGRTATRAALEAAGVRTFGTTVIRLSGLRVVLTANDLGDGVPAELPSQLSLARARGEVLVATFHVTGPPLLLPSPELKQAVEIALAAGATVVLAHGTHALASGQ